MTISPAPERIATWWNLEDEISMLDSSGIGLLVQYLTNTKQQGGSLKLLNPSPFSIKTLKMIGLMKLFEVFEDQESALATFGS